MVYGLMLILTKNSEIDMADAKPEDFRFGILSGSYYTFNNEGDVVDTHYHATNLGHICVVLSGEVTCESVHLETNWVKTVRAGEVLDTPDEQWHRITALKPNTKIMNINKYMLWTPDNSVIGH